MQVNDKSSADAPRTSATATGFGETAPFDNDDDDLDMDELNELEASLSRTSIQIHEPGIHA